MEKSQDPRYMFRAGDHALLSDRKGRRYLVALRSEGRFESHIGVFPHADLIGQEEGTWLTSATGHRLLAMKPTLADFSLLMPRIATVVYPKDLAAILVHGDIFPGARVLEAGAGSGAVTMALTRAVGEHGSVFAYDVRPDMIERALANVSAMLPGHSNLTLKLGDVYEGFEEDRLDRIVLDLPGPWRVVSHASERMEPRRHLSQLFAYSLAGPRADSGPEKSTYFRLYRDLRGPHKGLVCQRAQRAAIPPHDRTHRVHHHGPEVFSSARPVK